MTQKLDLAHVYTMDDLKKLQQAGASAEELRQGHQMMSKNNQRREKATKELVSAMEDFSFDKMSDALEKGADVNAKDMYGSTALILACRYGYTDMARLLIKKGADVNAKNRWNETALKGACYNGNMDVAQLLIEKGALTRDEQAVQEERSAKAQEIRQVDSDTNGKLVDHSLRRALYGGKQKGQNAPLNPTVARRMHDKTK